MYSALVIVFVAAIRLEAPHPQPAEKGIPLKRQFGGRSLSRLHSLVSARNREEETHDLRSIEIVDLRARSIRNLKKARDRRASIGRKARIKPPLRSKAAQRASLEKRGNGAGNRAGLRRALSLPQ